jgi:hypothetical protein
MWFLDLAKTFRQATVVQKEGNLNNKKELPVCVL